MNCDKQFHFDDNHFQFDYSDAVIVEEKLCPVSVGTVTTGEPGSEASVTVKQEENSVVLDFQIPRGAGGTVVGARTEALDTYYDVSEEDPPLAEPRSDIKKITVMGEDGNDVFYAHTSPGLYGKVPLCVSCHSHDVVMKVNRIYRYAPTVAGDHLKLTPDRESCYRLQAGAGQVNNRWRIQFDTNSPGDFVAGQDTYVGYLHLPEYVEVPKGWVGETSSLYPSYRQYRLLEKTFHDVTVEEVGGHYRLICNVDYGAPLIVTGSPKCEKIIMGGGTTNYAVYEAPLFSSHATKEIVDAFDAGRYVHILLKNPMPMMWLGTSTVLPDISYIEASVVSVVAAMNAVEAVGMGYCTNGDQTYSVKISVSGNNKPQITAHLFKAYDSNAATKTDINNALKNVASADDIVELKAYVDEKLEDVGYKGYELVPITQEAYDALVSAGTVEQDTLYLIKEV